MTATLAVVLVAATVTLAGTLAALLLLEFRVMAMPLAGAAADNVTVRVDVPPAGQFKELGKSVMVGWTLIGIVTFAREALLAEIFAVPIPTPVTGTLTVVEPAGMVTVKGTVAIATLSELRLMTAPFAGALSDSVRVTFCAPAPAAMSGGLAGHNRVSTTLSGALPVPKPVAAALMLAVPKFTPVTVTVVVD